jgi:hypothetical protein
MGFAYGRYTDGVAIIGSSHMYLVPDVALETAHALDDSTLAQCSCVAFTSMALVMPRLHCLQPKALELFVAHGQTLLLVCTTQRLRDKLVAQLQPLCSAPLERWADLAEPLHALTKRWCDGRMSNFEYLMQLNTFAGRSYNDLSQYPIFPWVLADYHSDELDLNNRAIYRDLSKPMGALREDRAEHFMEFYENSADESLAVPPFHYGSHYSSAMTTLYYLIRLEPFTAQFVELQGGSFDRADRLFFSVGETFANASTLRTNDVRELVPEFYYLPEFLCNARNLDLGVRQSGEVVGDVVLPPWAHGSAHRFVRMHREALESRYVSENLHEWIDLIFGYKQRGRAAVAALNVFYYLTYEGAVDLEQIGDEVQRAAIESQIANFGQTPAQLFKKPHPRRAPAPAPGPRDESEELRRSGFVALDTQADTHSLRLPKQPYVLVAGYADGSIQVRSSEADRLVCVHENTHISRVSCLSASDDGSLLASGSTDACVRLWSVGRQASLDALAVLCAHTAAVLCVHACGALSLVVSGGADGLTLLWDVRKRELARVVDHAVGGVCAVAMSAASGDICSCLGDQLRIFSVNGSRLAVVSTDSAITRTSLSIAAAFASLSIVTSHADGTVRSWELEWRSGAQAASPERASSADPTEPARTRSAVYTVALCWVEERR